jgi:N-acetylglucosamine-6-sulfatase
MEMMMRMMMRPLVVLLFALLPGLFPTAFAASRPDVIVIILDDMRASDWRALPQTRALLEDGTWYPNFILTTPTCCPSRASILTGRYAHNHGATDSDEFGWERFRPNELSALPMLLPGYDSALIGKYLNGFTWSDPTPPGWALWDPSGPKYEHHGGYSTDVQRDLAVAFVGDDDPDPKFLWFAPDAPHGPAISAPRHAEAFPDATKLDRKRLRTILAVDEAVVAIYQAMEPERAAHALWFVLSDNGYLIQQHDIRSGKNVPYDPAVRVPMLARIPGIPAGTDERIAANIDLAPTILRAVGEPIPARMDGRDLHASWERDGILIEGWNARTINDSWQGVWTVDTTYVEWASEPIVWDRTSDPGEERNALTATNSGRWDAWLDALRACAGEACRQAEHAP